VADLLVLAERVSNAIRLGESHFREFKSAYRGRPGGKIARPWDDVARDIGEALVAFANADGGDLLVGVEDDGAITGVPHSNSEIRQLLSAPQSHVHSSSRLPVQLAARLNLKGAPVLFFSVSKGTQSVFQLPDGRCVRRVGTSTVPESVDRILFERREAQSRGHDSEFIDGAEVGDLDVARVNQAAQEYLSGITPEKFLQQIGLAEYGVGGLRLRRAALLLFAKDISLWHPRCQVRFLKITGQELKAGKEYNVVSDETAQGNVFELLTTGWERLRPYLAYGTKLQSDTRFEQQYIYPEGACREALVNAITHRDYSVHNAIEVFVFDDRMDVKSPGALLSTINVEQLLRLEGAHESRNALVSRALRESGYVRELGEGMRRIFQLMEANDLRAPDLGTDENSFTVTLYNKSVFSDQQKAWLDLFAGAELSQLQQRIVVAGMDSRELSPADIYGAMNSQDRNTYDREVTALRKRGLLIEMRTNPAATQMARRMRKPKSYIPRFRVVTLDKATPQPLGRPTPTL
jgi:ATP-dependent DNA helicase RecG